MVNGKLTHISFKYFSMLLILSCSHTFLTFINLSCFPTMWSQQFGPHHDLYLRPHLSCTAKYSNCTVTLKTSRIKEPQASQRPLLFHLIFSCDKNVEAIKVLPRFWPGKVEQNHSSQCTISEIHHHKVHCN